MADYTKKELRKRDAGEFQASLGNSRYTVFPDTFDPDLIIHGLRARQAIRQLEEWSGVKVFLYRSTAVSWGYGAIYPVNQAKVTPDTGKIRYQNPRVPAIDADEARKLLSHDIIISGLLRFRGLHTVDFARHLRTLRDFVQLDRMAPADTFYEAAKAKCWPRDVANLALFPQMARNVIEAREPPNVMTVPQS